MKGEVKTGIIVSAAVGDFDGDGLGK